MAQLAMSRLAQLGDIVAQLVDVSAGSVRVIVAQLVMSRPAQLGDINVAQLVMSRPAQLGDSVA